MFACTTLLAKSDDAAAPVQIRCHLLDEVTQMNDALSASGVN
jgi:hypothetical protein